jgi:hypothetical protein
MSNLSSGHARMLPTVENTFGTQKAIFLVSGPGGKQGYERFFKDRQTLSGEVVPC